MEFTNVPRSDLETSLFLRVFWYNGAMNLEEIFPLVQRPARYIGGEWNQIKKDWTAARTKVLLAFPDLYDVGMSYLGLRILYGILNEREDCLAERVFTPWPDLEDLLRKNSISLYSLESRRPIKDFDIIGFSFAYELNYTNVLNMLDMGGIPIRSSERSDSDPLIIAGGPSCYNPEPMADFIDVFVIGDGEEVITEIVERFQVPGSRKKILRELAKIPGIYVPSLYNVEYNDDRTIKSFLPIDPGVSPKIEKRVVKDFENAYYPTAQIVPYIQTIHDRIAIEILRGCKHACKFCLSGATYRPWRERSKDKVIQLAKESCEKTGYEEISLLSLSTGDHSEIREIVEGMNLAFKDKGVSISVPSLRIQDILSNLPILLSQVKKPGLTFAPESGSECLRKFINKNIEIEKLFKAVEESFKAGWNRVKLYFMIGLPTETDEDVLSIARLAQDISNSKRAVDGKAAYVSASINAFVPKPHTPFQWHPMDGVDSLKRKKDMLRKAVGSRKVELDFNAFDRSYLECAFSRGDRRLGEVIYEAWKSGAKFDSWKEYFNFDKWIETFKKLDIDPAFYITRQRNPEEILPWDLIDTGIKKEALVKLSQERPI
jgi:radical SAM family uncharacterized protein